MRFNESLCSDGIDDVLDELLEEREDIWEALQELPEFLPGPKWHETEQHILWQCLIDIHCEIEEYKQSLAEREIS